ncbi:MAG: sporulation protein YunB [Dethiobacter sp.]|nr:sporulation protein YunB [Dethiobacter sp.]MBS3988337.1 sporulation protein YunB [Dethiobacter sp.]
MLGRRVNISRQAIVFFVLAAFLFTVIRLFMFIEQSMRPAILSIASARANIIATEAINEAVREKFARDVFYQDLIHLEKNREGRIVMAQTNIMAVNKLLAETTLEAQKALAALKGERIHIPIGQILGSNLLAGLGPRIQITLIPVGFVNTSVVDQFEEAGINQVRHKIYFNIQAEVEIVIPFLSRTTKVSSMIPIVDAIYPGDVPDTVIDLQFPAGQTVPLPFPVE